MVPNTTPVWDNLNKLHTQHTHTHTCILNSFHYEIHSLHTFCQKIIFQFAQNNRLKRRR